MSHIEIDFYLLKPLIKLFIKAGALSDMDMTVDYPKNLFWIAFSKQAGASKSAPIL